MLSKVITKKISSRKVQFSGHFLTFFTLVENHQKSLLFQFLNFCIKKSIFNIEYFVVFGVKKCIFLLSFRTVLWEKKFPSKKKEKKVACEKNTKNTTRSFIRLFQFAFLPLKMCIYLTCFLPSIHRLITSSKFYFCLKVKQSVY